MAGGACMYAVAALAVGADRGDLDLGGLAQLLPARMMPNMQMTRVRAAIGRGDYASALPMARTGILQAPLDPRRLSAYGLVLGATGAQSKGYDAFVLAGQMGWRDPATQIFWMQAAAQLNDPAVAALRLDGLLRTRPEMAAQTELTEVFDSRPEFGAALIERLRSKPEWTGALLGSTRLLDGERLGNRVQLLQQMAQAGVKVGCEQIAQVVNPLARKGQFDQAMRLWRSHCDDRPSGAIMDGGFAAYETTSDEASPFRWQIPASGDLNVSAMAQKSGANLLALQNVSPTGLVAARQFITAPSGTYRLRWLAQDGAGKPSGAITPRLWCDNANQVGVDKPALMPDGRWQTTINVPARASCPAWQLDFTLQPTSAPVTFGSVEMVP